MTLFIRKLWTYVLLPEHPVNKYAQFYEGSEKGIYLELCVFSSKLQLPVHTLFQP